MQSHNNFGNQSQGVNLSSSSNFKRYSMVDLFDEQYGHL